MNLRKTPTFTPEQVISLHTNDDAHQLKTTGSPVFQVLQHSLFSGTQSNEIKLSRLPFILSSIFSTQNERQMLFLFILICCKVHGSSWSAAYLEQLQSLFVWFVVYFICHELFILH